MNEEILRKIVEVVANEHISVILAGIKESEKDFPYTIACASFIEQLKKKNIIVDTFSAFDSSIVDMVFREMSNYLAR